MFVFSVSVIMVYVQVRKLLVLCWVIFCTGQIRAQTEDLIRLVDLPWLTTSKVLTPSTDPKLIESGTTQLGFTSTNPVQSASLPHTETNFAHGQHGSSGFSFYPYDTDEYPPDWVYSYEQSAYQQYEPVFPKAKSGLKKKRTRNRKQRKRKSHKKISKKLKDKIISVKPGSYVPGGNPLPKLFKTAKACMKACAQMPNCLAGDWNKHTYRCYTHQATACDSRLPHKTITHFSKIPCQRDLDIPGVRTARVYIGVSQEFGVLMKKIKNIQDCIKECLTGAGNQFPTGATVGDQFRAPQLCFGIDYDFANHKCFLNLRIDFTDASGANGRRRLCGSLANLNRYLPLLTPNNNVVAMVFCRDLD